MKTGWLVLAGLLAVGVLLSVGCRRHRMVVVERRGPEVIYVRQAPPPVIVEQRSRPPAPHWVWIDGHYIHEHNRYVWVKGRWSEPKRRGAHWTPDRWVKTDRGWRHEGGHWD